MRATSFRFQWRRRAPVTPGRKAGGAWALVGAMGVLTLVLSACNVGGVGATTGSSLAANQTFTWPYVDSNDTMGYNEVLDPALITTLKDVSTINMIYTGLVTFKSNLGVRPDAATHWDIDSTGTIYTFHLRPNMKFSDGKPLTAGDFAYSIDRALDPNLCSAGSAQTYLKTGGCNAGSQPSQVYLSYILGAQDRLSGKASTIIANGDNPREGLNVLDPLTLRIRLSAPISFFLESLTYSTSFAVEKSLIDDPANAGGTWVKQLINAGCSGPFKIESYGSDKVMTLVPNPYWSAAFGQNITLKQVVRPVISTNDAEYAAYRAGQFDFTDVPPTDFVFAHGQADFHTVTSLETDYFGLNFSQPPFNNIKVRQALDLALNKQLLVDRIENGGAVPTNHIVPQGMPGFNPGLINPQPDGTQSLTGNQSAALTLLNQARGTCPAPGTFGEPDYCPYIFGTNPQAIVLYAPQDSATRVQLAQLAAQAWNQSLGINVQVKQASFDQIVTYITAPTAAQDPMQMWEIGWIADYPDPQDWLTLQFSTGSPYNASGISMASLDKLMSDADVEQDSAKRMQMYNQAEQIVVNQVAWIPFQQSKFYWRQREYVHGFGFNGIGLMTDVSWPNVYIAAH